MRFFGSLILLLFLLSCAPTSPIVRSGAVDLTAWDFQRWSHVTLDGRWLFTWEGSGNRSPVADLEVPRLWTQTEPAYPAEGKATYQIELRLPPEQKEWALAVPEISTAWRLLVDGELVMETGKVASEAREGVPRVRAELAEFRAKTPVTKVVLEVSNFHDRVGGFKDSLKLGPRAEMQAWWSVTQVQSALLAGGLLVLGVLNLFFLRAVPFSKGILWFSLLSIAVAFRGLVTGPTLLWDFLPGLTFEQISDLKFSTAIAGIAIFVMYLRRLFPDRWYPPVMLGFLVLSLVFLVLAAVTPTKLYSPLFAAYYSPLLLALLFYCLGIFFYAMYRKNPDATALFPGVLLLGLAALNDTISLYVHLPFGLLLPQGMFLFMLYNSWLISRQVEQTARENKTLADNLMQLDGMKDDFLARVTHELRTPLNGMRGVLDAFRNGDIGPLQERQSYHLSLLDASTRRLVEMVNSILDFSQLGSGKLALQAQPVDLRLTVDALLPLFHQRVADGVQFSNKISPHFPPALADPARTSQVIEQLLSNAVAHTRSGTIAVDAELNDQTVTVLVRDTGPGIAADIQKTLFSPFYQTERADTRRHEGIGLGLALSRQLVERMGGTLTLDSRPGEGTTVRLTLPECAGALRGETPVQPQPVVALPESEPTVLPPATPSPPPSADDVPSVLIVDDEPMNQLVLRTFLSRLKYKVYEATNGQEALAVIDSTPLHLVILDIMMPGMSGYEVTRAIRKRFSPAQLPVVLLTAKTQTADLLHGYQCGANDFLTKPFDRDELKARMEFHLSLADNSR